MRIEIDYDKQTIIVKEIEYYQELEKRMKELFGQDRINWKITFSEEITQSKQKTNPWIQGTISAGSSSQGYGYQVQSGSADASSGSISSSPFHDYITYSPDDMSFELRGGSTVTFDTDQLLREFAKSKEENNDSDE